MTLDTRAGREVPYDDAAEQQVLGSLLIDRDAIFKVADLLAADDFYVARNQRVYAAVYELLQRRERIDTLTVQMELARREELDRVGGVAYLADLIAKVPTAVEIERFAHVVRDKAVLRRLLGAATAIAADSYAEPTDMPLALDRAEQRLFALRDDTSNAQLRHIQTALQDNFQILTDRMDRPYEVSGIPSGFRELDFYTEGFAAGDLVVLASRPSVGKTSLALAIAFNTAKRGHPTLIFSLEMDAKQIVSRFLAMNSRSDLLALRTGNVFDTEAASALAGVPILIDDTPGLSIMELRTKARRATTHDRLEVIIVDYIQLMRTGGDQENRVQEIATITRNLKSLARELNVVVIGLSQLSRAAGDAGLEPKLSTLRECVTGETPVWLTDGRRVPIRDLVGTAPDVWSIDGGRIVSARSDLVWKVGVRPVFKVRLASGRTIRATAEHRLRGFSGWKRVNELHIGERLAITRRAPEPSDALAWPELRIALLGHLIGDGSYLTHQPIRYTTSSIANSDLVSRAAVEEFGCKANRQPDINGWHQVVISGNGDRWHHRGVGAWLRALGIWNQRSHQKQVPSEAFRLSNECVGLLLKHLWATDGSIVVRPAGQRGGHNVYYATNSPTLAADVSALLLRFGIVSRITVVREEGYRDGYQVHIMGTSAQRIFLDVIGGFGPRAAPALALTNAIADVVPNTNVDTVPREVFTLVRGRMASLGVNDRALAAMRGTAYNGTSWMKSSPSRTRVAEYASLLNDDSLLEIASSDLFWDRVVAIEPDGEAEVFDMTVPGTASWLADGIVSHNSGSLEQDSDIVVMLWKDKEDTPASAPRLIHGSVAKNRNGPTGIFTLLFASEQARFFSKAPDDQMPV